ncbi:MULTISPECIES: AsmA family protein [unclassified Marinobacter]|uniref:AsmA family protein n=1 Tax=unclassified Marinobacter TaxID=83889 RepID=UPI00200C502B|nr:MULTISPECIES: AsmA family protein [unclassified Marinobacter]UQG55317.1 AsmA family protein [Marinobacter sp. M4C]UQG64120.1 AsmA family protein [Marinobacter sp. M2C]UQG68404.1 AsmA family protein [Marinobacter sp. M1C]
MKALRYLLITIVALILLAVAAIAVAMLVIDPNTYKPQIEQAVEKQTNLDLILDGDISWSFIPIGLELNNVEAKLDGERFIALDRLVAEIDFWSLVAMSPQVNNFVLGGLDAHLSVNKEGQANWTRIMPEKDAQQAASSEPAPGATATTTTATATESEGSPEPLNFNVSNVEIANARVHYTDATTGQEITLEDFTLGASDITLGSEFPLSISFRVETTEPQMKVEGSIAARLSANQALDAFSASGLDASFDIKGDAFAGKTITAKISGSLAANLANETANLKDISLSFANLSANTNLNVEGFGDKPKLAGNIAINEFSLKKLLENLGQPAIQTSDGDVLTALALSTNIGGAAGKPELTDLTLKLDDTTFNGSGSYNLASSAFVFRLTGDELNADRYLPPPSDTPATESGTGSNSGSSSGTAAAQADPDSQLLPLDTLRALLLDIDLGLNKLTVSNLQINEIKASTLAKNGVLEIDDFSGKLYYGNFNANASIDARSDTPKWSINTDVAGVQTLPLLNDLAEVDMLSGGANLKINAKSTGNTMAALRGNADGKITFNLAEGEFRQMNLTRLACQGIALVNQETLGTTDWGTTTPFNDMRGTLDINGNTLNNTELLASLAGMQLEGQGSVDMQQTLVDYELGLRIVGEIHRDPACRVTDIVRNVVIPLECRGNLNDDPAGLCSFDGSRFRDSLQDIAKNAARAKVEKEIDRAKTKAEDKVKEKLQEKLGEGAGDKVKDALKGFFN